MYCSAITCAEAKAAVRSPPWAATRADWNSQVSTGQSLIPCLHCVYQRNGVKYWTQRDDFVIMRKSDGTPSLQSQ